ncbi:hypothetical protein MASR2M32_12890 [Sphaerotilus sulfidivorans]
MAAAATVLFLVILGLMLSQAERLVGLGLAGQMWFLLLLVLGLLAAVVLFAVFKSQAIYKGQVLNGTLQLGGPSVLMLVVVLLGHWLVPAPAVRFDVTVLLQGEQGGREARPLRRQGQLMLDLGSDQRTEAVGEKGEVRFMALPADLRGKTVGVTLLGADAYELIEPSVTLGAEAARLTVRPRLLVLQGEVQDVRGRPLAQAQVRVAGQQVASGPDGHFALRLPADPPEAERRISVRAVGFEPWDGQAVPGGGVLSVTLHPQKVSGK